MKIRFLISITSIFLSLCFSLHGLTYTCSSAIEIKTALNDVEPGDTIVINPGTYPGVLQSINGKSCHFGSTKSGIPGAPNTIKSANPTDRARLTGTDVASNYAFYIYDADYWVIRDVVITGAQKGIVPDKSNYTKIINCEIHTIGMEGFHFRDGSSNCSIEDSAIHDTGVDTPGYGEGVYVGLTPSNFNEALADTNCDGSVDIVDALLVAQYYVGLITVFC